MYITKKGQRNCELKHKAGEKPFKCDVAGCDIDFYSRRSKKKHERQQNVSFKIKAVRTGHTLMITCSSIRGLVNSTKIGLNTSVSCVERRLLSLKMVQEHKHKEHKGYN